MHAEYGFPPLASARRNWVIRVANHYHKSTSGASGTPQAGLLQSLIEAFLSTCRRPAVLEFGEEPRNLVQGQYALETRNGKLWFEIWSDDRSLSRRILGVESQSHSVVDCTIQRFGGRPGRLSFLDLDRPQSAHKMLCGQRQNFGEQFRRMLFRQFPGWEISTLTSSMDLQRSFSAIYPRACLSRGNQQIAAVACACDEDEAALLTSAVIWFDYVRQRAREGIENSLHLFLPDSSGTLTAQRLRWLTGGPFAHSNYPRMFRFNSHGSAGEIDPCDLGNLDTRISPTALNPNGLGERTSFGFPEQRLEGAVRSGIAAIDPTLAPAPIHSQVLTFAATDRDLIDLLAVSTSGRLAVLELKVNEDVHLPMQALDYWMRIRWHAQRDELRRFFPGVRLESTPPKLLLVAPALSFHSSNAVILRYFAPEIKVERVGINSDWQQSLKVVMRLDGAAVPISHGRL